MYVCGEGGGWGGEKRKLYGAMTLEWGDVEMKENFTFYFKFF